MGFSFVGLLIFGFFLATPSLVQAELSANYHSWCPADLEKLTTVMLQELPNYANRVIHSSQSLGSTNSGYVIVAGQPEFKPLKLNELQYTPVLPESSEQVFFTTLERQYLNGKIVEVQNYHWLFLTQTPTGWRMIMIFSRTGSDHQNRPPAPPQETSNGVIGQAIGVWLRDCNSRFLKDF
ncbi:MAG: hypothetical protein DSM107014_00095 [Gomphosphaeria aponina SAG 52.96 = DSM 107014]|uniref:Uncharacterized protein n=1 Tax=Gomphosphaeria aponina SAG 52.96 = DSM 107014 TaxID=1521640 RepID=A0A941JUA1_9CHRO|nr:hypothetical protein [Gomphosphaeria aponina SAG 52.96 = DSM 107014]